MKKQVLLLMIMVSIILVGCGQTKEEKVTKTTPAVDKTINSIVEKAESNGEKISDEDKQIVKEALKNSEAFEEKMKNEMEELEETLPNMLKLTKIYRNCLSDADSKKEAIECYTTVEKLMKDMGIEDEDNYEYGDEYYEEDEYTDDDGLQEIGEWRDEDKEKLLGELDQAIKQFEAIENMGGIKNIEDLQELYN